MERLPLAFVVLAALSGACSAERTEPAPAAAASSAGEEAGSTASPAEPLAAGPERYMQEHFVLAVYARDAIVGGDLESLRQPLAEFARFGYDDVAPGGWLPWVAELQRAAQLVSEAQTLEAGAAGVAAMGRVCGDCHTKMHAGPGFVAVPSRAQPPESESLAARMFRHVWGTDQLWRGLIGPSDEAWDAGAEVLARAPDQVSDVSAELAARLAAARQIGQDARDASTPDARTERMAELLAGCAGCHAEAQGAALAW